MILIVLKAIICITVVCFFGWNFVRRVLKQNELYLTIPLSLFFGVISYVFILNVSGYFMAIQTAFYFAYLLLSVSAIAIYFFVKAEKIELGISKKHFVILGIVTIVMTGFFAIIIKNNYQHDRDWHYGTVATIIKGNFPVKNIYIPFNYAQYHYAFDLLAASVSSILGIGVIAGMDSAYIVFFAFVFWMIFSIAFKFSKSISVAYFSAILFFFGGGFRYFTIVRDIDWANLGGFSGLISQVAHLYNNVIPMQAGYFSGYSTSAFGTMLYHPPTMLTFPITMLVVYLMYLEDKNRDVIYKVVLGVFLGFLALVSEVAFVYMALSWGIWKLLNFFKDKKYVVVSILTVAVISSFVAVYHGGVISDAILHTSSVGLGADTSVSRFGLRSVPGLISFGAIYPFNQIYSYAFLLIEWGFPLLLFPFAFYFFKKRRDVALFIIVVIVTLITAFIVDYPVSVDNLARLNVVAYIFMGLLAATVLGIWYDRNKMFRPVILLVVILMVISPVFYNIKLLSARIEKKDFVFNNVDKNGERDFANQIDSLIPGNAAVLTANPVVVNEIWGRLSYFGTPTKNAAYYREVGADLPPLLKILNIDYLKERKIDYVYYDQKFIDYGGGDFLKNNLQKFTELARDDHGRILYRIN